MASLAYGQASGKQLRVNFFFRGFDDKAGAAGDRDPQSASYKVLTGAGSAFCRSLDFREQHPAFAAGTNPAAVRSEQYPCTDQQF
jgi:hypothetical protein